MPALRITPEQFTALPADRQADYAQAGDVYELVLDGELDTHTSIATNVAGLKKTAADLKAEKEKFQADLAAFKATGATAEQVAQWKKDHATAEQRKLEEAGNYQELIRQAAEKHQNDLKAAQDAHASERSFLERVLEKNLIDREATAAIIAAGGDKNTVALLLPHVKAQLKAAIQGEGEARDYVVQVVGPNGPRVKDASGALMGIPDLALEMKTKPEFMPAFPASGAGGGGAANNTGRQGNSKSMPRAAFFQMTPAEQSKFSVEGGILTD